MSRKNQKLKVLVTAGPTRAYLDDVRFLSNISTGTLGYEVCKNLKKRGVELYIVVGPTTQPFKTLRAKRLIEVETNAQMQKAVLALCQKYVPQHGIFSAAVLDFAPEKILSGKVTSANGWVLKLLPTPKIIDLVARKFPLMKKTGFKLECKKCSKNQLKILAAKNMKEKGLDSLIVNFLSEVGTKKHKAYHFQKDGQMTIANTKKQIALLIANQILGT